MLPSGTLHAADSAVLIGLLFCEMSCSTAGMCLATRWFTDAANSIAAASSFTRSYIHWRNKVINFFVLKGSFYAIPGVVIKGRFYATVAFVPNGKLLRHRLWRKTSSCRRQGPIIDGETTQREDFTPTI